MENIHIPSEIQHYEKKVYDQRQLIELSKALNSRLDLPDLIDSILNSCLAQVQTFHAGILMRDGVDTEHLILHPEFKGFEIVNHQDYKIDIDSPLVEYFTKDQSAITWDKLSQDDTFKKEMEVLADLDLQLLIPMLAKGEMNGIIVLGAKATGINYPYDEIYFLENLASLAGIAANNARLYELATTDMMTHLKLRHYFMSRLREEMKKSLRRDKPLTLLFTDIDHFKSFNDTYGHQAGDFVLTEVAGILIDKARKVDTPARYGGEEFCLIMPQTDEKAALKIAESIRKEVEITTFSHEEHELKVTISIGVAQYSPEDEDIKNLIEKADKALYKAKRSGRNQCVVYTRELEKESISGE
jgi:diguanylate cyclase (GGDEF)-like protein